MLEGRAGVVHLNAVDAQELFFLGITVFVACGLVA